MPSRRNSRPSPKHGSGIESQEVAKGLDGNDGAGDGIPLRHRLLKKELQEFPGAAAQSGKKIPVIEEVPAQDFKAYLKGFQK